MKVSSAVAVCMACALTVSMQVSAFLPPLGRSWATTTTASGRRRSSGIVMMGRRAAKIAKTKGKEDAKRGKVNARMGKKLIMAVKAGGPSEEANKLLADTIKEAKLLNVPKDNIARAIKRASEGAQGDFKEAVYEAYGHGGVGIVVTALTDNPNRCVANIKTALKKFGLKQAASGSVLFQFAKKGKVEVAGEVDEEKVIEAAIEAGADDVEVVEGDDEGTAWILTEPKDLFLLSEALAAVDITGEPSLVLIPQALTDVGNEDLEMNLAGIDALEQLDDVDMVDHNMA